MGNVIDALWAIVIIVTALTTALAGMYVMGELNTEITNEFPTVTEAQDVTTDTQDWIALIDGGVILVFFSYILVILLVSYLMPSNTAFAVLMFIIILVQIPVADILQHYVNVLINTSEFSAYADSFPNTLLILDNSPLILVITAILTAAIQFGKGSLYGGENLG